MNITIDREDLPGGLQCTHPLPSVTIRARRDGGGNLYPDRTSLLDPDYLEEWEGTITSAEYDRRSA